MRSIKALGLAAVAALAIAAFAGAGSASATTLCKENVGYPNTCPESQQISLPVTLQGAAEVTFLSEALELEGSCSNSEIKLAVEEDPGEGQPLTGQLTEWTLEGCYIPYTACQPSKFLNLPYKAELTGSESGDTLTLKDGGSGSPAVEFNKCGYPWGPVCTYGASELNLDFEGGELPSVIAADKEGLTLESGEGNCAFTKEWKMSADYPVASPSIETNTSSSVLKDGEGETVVACSTSMTGHIADTLSAFSWKNCEDKFCDSGGALSLPYETTYSVSGKTVSFSPELEFTECTYGITCKYGGSTTVYAPSGEIVASSESLAALESNGDPFELCPAPVYWSATYSNPAHRMYVVSKP